VNRQLVIFASLFLFLWAAIAIGTWQEGDFFGAKQAG
jgi:hypothetical protein